MLNLKIEISHELPENAIIRTFKGGEPILYAFNCALLESDTGKSYIYTAVNLTSGVSQVITRRANPLTTSGVEAIVEQIRKSKIAGAGRFKAERPIVEQIGLNKANEILQNIFKKILPKYGYAIRKEQIDLAKHILMSISNRGVTLAEAEVGTGKTFAYLVPAIIAKRGRYNNFWNCGLYPKMQYADMSKMPIVIATSSIALQRAIMTDYIPEISRILLENEIIDKPLTAVIRKGKEHYICERNLRAYLSFDNNKAVQRILDSLSLPSANIDMAEIDVLPHIKRKICVSGRCSDHCPHRESCQYLEFREKAQSLDIDIQVCNHNYLLADTLVRKDGKPPLIPNYQMLVIDEAHKFLQAAQSMYGSELSSISVKYILNNIDRLLFKREGYQELVRKMAKKLFDESAKLFRGLFSNANINEAEDDTERFNADMNKDTTRHLRNIRDISENLMFALRDEAFYVKAQELLDWVRKKYGVNTSVIDLKSLLVRTANIGETYESQKEYMHSQIVNLHRAISHLPDLERSVEIEKRSRKYKKGGSSTVQKVLLKDKAVVLDSIWKKSRDLLPIERSLGKHSEWIVKLIWDLKKIHEQVTVFVNHSKLICWLELNENANSLYAIPKDLNKQLFNDQWNKGISTIFTSGTLSAAGDFSHIKRTLGLEQLGGRITETSKPSPFNHKENALLYISENTPFPDQKDKNYIAAVADEVERLILSSHGHAAVLFTSYKMMELVYIELKKRRVPFPLFILGKGGVMEIERFKRSNGGVLFASGSLWEGIDIPGDALSMLIIVKLPFAVPDPIGEYEQTLYTDMNEYKSKVVVPEMLIKLKQGFGRLIRTEKDTGAVAILDSRVNISGSYRKRVLDALPNCRITNSIEDIYDFIRAKKSPFYYG